MRAALLVLIASPALALAEPVDDDTQVEVHAETDTSPTRKSYWIPIGEAFVMNVAVNAGAQAIGMDWADISLSSVRRNLTSEWTWDEDPFTINGLGHPYSGAMPFTAARSTGHDFWVSGLYSFGSSAFWELFMETEIPSLNDQLTTTVAGMLLGESLHRIGRALRTGNPGFVRETAATLLDPVGGFNRKIWGKPWRDHLPPSFYAHIGVGAEHMTRTYQDVQMEDKNAFHLDLVLQHGLPGDRDFEPRVPLDHFDVRASADISEDELVGALDIRGLVFGRGFSGGFYGLYGTYDYMNPDRVRVHAVGIGPGIATQTQLGDHGYFRATGVLTLVPWGSAGGVSESEDPTQRDYQRGPGLGQILELEVGRHRIGGMRLTSRAWEIDGTFVGDGRELVTTHTIAGHLALAKNHAIGIESTYSLRGATFMPEDMNLVDRTFEVRAFYALTSGRY